MLPLVQICAIFIVLKCHLIVQAIVFDEVPTLQVWLTIDSLAKPTKDKSGGLLSRQIELNWLNAPLDPDGQDYIALYLDAEPEDQPQAVPVAIHRPTSTSGRVVTNYYLPYIDFYNETLTTDTSHRDQQREINLQEPAIDYQLEGSGGGGGGGGHQFSFGMASDHNNRWHQHNSYGAPPPARSAARARAPSASESEFARARKGHAGGNVRQSWSSSSPWSSPPNELAEECLGYCVAYQDGRGRVLARSCLRTRPNWMLESRLGSRSLPSLMLPGTHNSGTYPKHLDRTVLQMISKYQINQEESVFNQLVFGIRYLDLRVGFSKVKGRPGEELWIYHDIFRTDNSLDEVLEQVRRFLEMTKGELVVLDFHRFTVGFQNENMKTQLERHDKLLNLLFKTLGDWIVPAYLGQHAPMNEYLEKGKRLVVCYANRAQLLGSQLADQQQQPQQSILFGALTASGKPLGLVRDVDADKQDADMNVTLILANAGGQQPVEPHQETDRRMGARIYNRLKSLKLISHSFSKRSAPGGQQQQQQGQQDQAELRQERSKWNKSANVYKKQRTDDQHQHGHQPERFFKLMSAHTPLVADSMNSKLSLLFNSVRHIWPNTDTEAGLRQFIEGSACRKHLGELRSLMAEMTPGVFGAISDQYDGIRRMSHLTNRMVTDQIRSKFLHCLNMVASDYFLGNDLIRLSIFANKMRLHNQGSVDLSSIGGGQCGSFRRIESLLDKSRIGSMQSQTSPTISTSTYQVHPDKESDLFSFFRKIFNL